MSRPRNFDELKVLDDVMSCFWLRGYEATSVRDLVEATGLTSASLYNAFGDKRMLYQKALEHYVKQSISARIRRCAKLRPRQAIKRFFSEIATRSLSDSDRKGCMLMNAAVDTQTYDLETRELVAGHLVEIELFFRRCIVAGQADGSFSKLQKPEDLARHLLSVLVGLRVLARVRPERALMNGLAESALAFCAASGLE